MTPLQLPNRLRVNLGKTFNLSSSKRGMADDTTRISVRPVRAKKLPILTGQQSLPRLRSIGDVAKRLRRWIANPLFVGSNPTVASFGGNSA